MKNLILALIVFATTQGFAHGAAGYLETVMGYRADRNGLSFQAYDGGCTAPEDFDLRIDRSHSGQVLISLYRTHRDFCKAFFSNGQTIRFEYKAIGLNKYEIFQIENPINPGFIGY